jgi:hypothetical protein
LSSSSLLAKTKSKKSKHKAYLNQVGGGCGLEQSLCPKIKTENAKKEKRWAKTEMEEGGGGV